MNDDLRELLIEEMGLRWCPIINTHVDKDCFKYCADCKDNIEFNEYFDKEIKQMTIKEKLETIKGNKIAIWCCKEYEARIIHKYLDFEGFDYVNNCYWDNYGMFTCYDYQRRLMYADKNWYKENGYDIILFRDFMNGIDLGGSLDIKLSHKDINKILDEKYGRDNWVIE